MKDALMKDRPEERSLREGSGIVAAFDEWRELGLALETVAAEFRCFKAILHGRKDAPDPTVLGAVDNVTEVECARFRRGNARTKDAPVNLMIVKSTGSHAAASELRRSISAEQAWHLQDHLEKGRVLLWLLPRNDEQFGMICAGMIRSSPHVVEICDGQAGN
jgi:hypothetical protein